VVGFDFLAGAGLARIVAVPHPNRREDPIEEFIATLTDRAGLPVSVLVVAAWRAALRRTLDGGDAKRARAALATLRIADVRNETALR
jgi:hypothetical protein